MSVEPCSAALPSSPEDALFVVRLGITRNPWAWGVLVSYVLIRILLGGLLLGFLGLMLWDAAPWTYAVGCALMALVEYRRLRRRDSGSFEFHERHIVIDWRSTGGQNVQQTVRYEDVSQIALPAGDRIQLVFTDEDGKSVNRLVFPVERKFGEDVFDHLVEHLETTLLDHPVTVVEGGEIRYTRPWEFDSRYPGQPSLDLVSLVRKPGSTPDIVVLGPRQLYLKKGVAELVEPGSSDPLLLELDTSIVDGRGFTVAVVSGKVATSLTISLGDHLEWEYRQAEGGQFFEHGDVVGRAVLDATGLRLEFDRPVHPICAASLLMILRQRLGDLT